MNRYDISVIVCTYNPDYSKLFWTIRSVVLQKNVSLQIVIADDGSRAFDRKRVEEIFEKQNFYEYKIVDNKANAGTCKNIYSALPAVEGKYVKLISPGDYLYKADTLRSWIDYVEANEVQISYGEVVCYSGNEDIEIFKVKEKPEYKGAYKKRIAPRVQLIDYVLLSDFSIGAAFISTADFLKEYLTQIIGRVIYAEDMIYRMAIWDGVRIACFHENVVWYEYGTGVSTSSNDKWRDIIQKDIDACSELIFTEDRCRTYAQRALVRAYRRKSRISGIKYVVFPETIFISLSRKLNPKYNTNPLDMDFYTLLKKVNTVGGENE